MDELEDFIIGEPYTMSNDDECLISSSLSDSPKAEDWYNDRLQEFKGRFKSHIERQQNCRCAYCRTYVDTGNSPFDIEHIVPKSKHVQWTFKSENLCLSCRKCNFSKGQKETLINTGTDKYPQESSGFKIVHPYYDKYSDHVELIGGFLYRGLTDKGRFTIETCRLDRYELAVSRVRQKLLRDAGDDFPSILKTCILNYTLVDNLSKLIEKVNDIIERYKNIHRW